MKPEAVAAWLRLQGYVVIPKERRVIVQGSHSIARTTLESTRDPDSLQKMAQDDLIRRIACEALNSGLIVQRFACDLDSYTASAAAAFIKPKPVGDD